MNVDQLEYFRHVARLGHVSRAAEELAITQPALSRAIARLERDVGAALFARTGRTIVLTRYGRAFLAHVERALDEIDAGRRELGDLTGADDTAVALGFLRTLGARFVPQTVRLFRTEHPDVRFTFSQNNSATLLAQATRGEVALCLIAGPLATEGLRWQRIGAQRFLVIVPPQHRLARRRSVRLADLRAETFIAYKRGQAIRDFSDALCRAAGFVPAVAFEADESASVRAFVLAGFGIAIVPELSGSDELPNLRILDANAAREIGVTWRGDRYLSKAERAFRRFLLEPDRWDRLR